MNTTEEHKIDIYQMSSLLFLFGFYILTFYIFMTGNDILKGEINILSIQFDKLMSYVMFLTLLTISIPLYALGNVNNQIKQSNKRSDNLDNSIDKIDKWLGVKVNENYTSQELSESRFKAVYQVLYVFVILNILLGGVLIYLNTETYNTMEVGIIVGGLMYGLFTFIFQKQRDVFMLGIVSLVMMIDKIGTIIILGKVGGLSIVILLILLVNSIVAFRSAKVLETNTKVSTLSKNISRFGFLIITILVIVGTFA